MRIYENLNNNWFFSKDQFENIPIELTSNWEDISLPHTWNCFDGQDGGADYYRGKCWYIKELTITKQQKEKELYLEFNAVSAYCRVYLNGIQVGEHKGGYSTFRIPITEFVREGKNILSVMVSNEALSDIYPQMADFTFYGGIYRDVKMITVEKTHFDLDYYGGNGIQIQSEITGKNNAFLRIYGFITNPCESDQMLFRMYDSQQKEIVTAVQPATENTFLELQLSDLILWQGIENPYLYQMELLLLRHNEVIDEVHIPYGFRHFHVDPQKGFFLNGKLTPLRGVSRHQDKLGIGNALTKEDHRLDAELIKELGANTIRLAHYQHSQDFYDVCDEMGFIIWAEIPFISKMNPDEMAHENCINQMKELIIQNFHHCSICTWGISNEITIGGNSPKLVENLKKLNDLVHELDPSRLSTMAQVSALPMEDVQNTITDVISYNHYFGWYNGTLEDNEKWLDTFHERYPNRPLGISEYGCEGIITYHNDNPKAGDYSEEYQALYHEHMIQVIEKRPWLWATHIWNMFDFGCDARNEGGVAGRNNKGLVTFDRKIKKDSFYLYQAYWSKKPMIHICGKRYAKRSCESISIKVYSNASAIQLYVDGKPFLKKTGNRIFLFENVPLHEGFTSITVKSDICSDTCCFEKVDTDFKPYEFVPDESQIGVTNWFEYADLEIERPFTFHEDCYSIKDTVKDILSNEEAGMILVNAVSSISGISLNKSLLMMMGDRTLEEMFSESTSTPNTNLNTDAMIAYMNEQFQKIKK